MSNTLTQKKESITVYLKDSFNDIGKVGHANLDNTES